MHRRSTLHFLSSILVISVFFFNLAHSGPDDPKQGKKRKIVVTDSITNQDEVPPLNEKCLSTTKASSSLDLTPHRQLAEQIIRKRDSQWLGRIDDESYEVMAKALKFSDINTIEKALELDLRLCPPAPVLYTWAAINGTTLLDGKNDELNYVAQIADQASQLSRDGIPVIVVYSKVNLGVNQCRTMEDNFREHPNVITLQLEDDLKYRQEEYPWLSKFYGKISHSQDSINFMDSIRLIAIKNPTRTLTAARNKAINKGKAQLSESITSLGGDRIFYSDIDNPIYKFIFTLASKGIFQCHPLHHHYFPLGDKVFEEEYKELSEDSLELLRYHHSHHVLDVPHFQHNNEVVKNPEERHSQRKCWDINKQAKLFYYITSGEGVRVYDQLVTSLIANNPKSSQSLGALKRDHNRFTFFDIDNGAIYTTEEKADYLINTIRKANSSSINTFNLFGYQQQQRDGFSSEKERSDATQSITLSGIQQLHMYCIGHDHSY